MQTVPVGARPSLLQTIPELCQQSDPNCFRHVRTIRPEITGHGWCGIRHREDETPCPYEGVGGLWGKKSLQESGVLRLKPLCCMVSGFISACHSLCFSSSPPCACLSVSFCRCFSLLSPPPPPPFLSLSRTPPSLSLVSLTDPQRHVLDMDSRVTDNCDRARDT